MTKDQKRLMLARYVERRNALNWTNSGGDAALDWFVGACCGMEIAGMKPLSQARTFPYVGYAASGTKYYATRRHDGRGWRFALAISSLVDEPPYFYVRTLAEASTKLETIKGS